MELRKERREEIDRVLERCKSLDFSRSITVKNYRALCALLGIEEKKSRDSKASQLKALHQILNFKILKNNCIRIMGVKKDAETNRMEALPKRIQYSTCMYNILLLYIYLTSAYTNPNVNVNISSSSTPAPNDNEDGEAAKEIEKMLGQPTVLIEGYFLREIFGFINSAESKEYAKVSKNMRKIKTDFFYRHSTLWDKRLKEFYEWMSQTKGEGEINVGSYLKLIRETIVLSESEGGETLLTAELKQQLTEREREKAIRRREAALKRLTKKYSGEVKNEGERDRKIKERMQELEDRGSFFAKELFEVYEIKREKRFATDEETKMIEDFERELCFKLHVFNRRHAIYGGKVKEYDREISQFIKERFGFTKCETVIAYSIPLPTLVEQLGEAMTRAGIIRPRKKRCVLKFIKKNSGPSSEEGESESESEIKGETIDYAPYLNTTLVQDYLYKLTLKLNEMFIEDITGELEHRGREIQLNCKINKLTGETTPDPTTEALAQEIKDSRTHAGDYNNIIKGLINVYVKTSVMQVAKVCSKIRKRNGAL